jgi:death-on-curing protein
MESLGGEVAYPTPEQIYEVNRRMIETYGGRFDPPHNLSNASALEYILEALCSSVFFVELYPTLKEKAAALAFHIITRHVFMDGNKRTGIHISWEFLHANGVEVVLDESIIGLAEDVARGTRDFHDLLGWLHDHQPT